MAGFRTHIVVSTACGAGYGVAAALPGDGMGFTPAAAFLAGTVTAVGGMLPDLDSDSGRPVREVSSLCAAVLPLLLMPRLVELGQSQECRLASLVVLYIVTRYGLADFIGRVSVHRGMFHSLPAMLTAGLVVYLEYSSPNTALRLLLAGGVMLGFLSHLILDEIYSVDFNGVRVRLSKSAGSALKFVSPSWVGTAVCYGLLAGFAMLVYLDAQLHALKGE